MKFASVLLTVSCLLSIALAVQPGLDDGEFLIDTSIALVPAPYNQAEAAVAFDGINFLVVWQSGDIYGARVTPQGAVLDKAGFVIIQADGRQSAPAVGFDGANFLVVWEDSSGGGDYDIYGARVTPQGTLLDSVGLVISQAAGDQHTPGVDFDGTNSLVVWEDCRSDPSGDIYGARVTPQGVVLDPSGLAISQATGGQCNPAVDFGSADFFVVWEDTRGGHGDIYGTRVTGAGVVLDSSGIVVSQAVKDQQRPALSFDGAHFLVAWHDGRDPNDYLDIYGARVTSGGVVLDPSGILISASAYNPVYASLGFDGANFLVTWSDDRVGGGSDIYGARVTSQGRVLDSASFSVSRVAGDQAVPAVSLGDSDLLVVWQDRRSGPSGIYGARVTPQGTVPDSSGIAISQVASDQYTPAIGYDGANFLAVWEDRRNGNGDIFGARVTPEGIVLDPSGIVICHAPDDQYTPAVGFDGTNFLVVWGDMRHGSGSMDVYGARVTPQGAVLDTAGIVISQAAHNQGSPAIAFDGTNSVVVWTDFRSGTFADVYGARVTPQGTVLDSAGVAISQAANDQWRPALCFDGASFLVVWQEYRGSDYDIYGARVTPQGMVLDPEGVVISGRTASQIVPVLDYDGVNFLVAWGDHRGATYDIYGARVTPEGDVLDSSGIAITHAAGDEVPGAICFDGANFLLVWEDNSSHIDWDICGAHVTPGGSVFDSGPVVSQLGDQRTPRLGCGDGNQVFLVYQGWAGAMGGKSYNTPRIWGKMNPSSAVAETMNDERGTMNAGPTIVRGVLLVPAKGEGRTATGELLDISGRMVLTLKPGANDVTRLSTGVYFAVENSVVSSQHSGQSTVAVRKIIIQK